MTYPTKPSTAYSFTDYQAANPTDPLPGNEVDADFAEHKTSIDATIDFVKIALRSDGNLNNGIVRLESLSAATLALMGTTVSFEGAWVTLTVYAVNDVVTESNKTYICIVAHTAGTFATDLAAGKWQLLEGDNASLAGANTWTGVQEFDAAVNFDAAVDFDGAVDFDSTIDPGGATVIGTITMTAKPINQAQGADIASATTTDIGAATGNYVKVTGTTTITGLGTIQAGTQRRVAFTGALLLTHNATSLILPGGANITTAAGDTADFVSEGSGNWRCLQYTRAAAKGATTYLGADVVLNNTGTFFSGPNTGSLPPGTYQISGRAEMIDSAGVAIYNVDIHNGTAALDTAEGTAAATNQRIAITLGPIVVTITAATTFTLRAKDGSSTSGTLLRSLAAAATANLATQITWVRLA